MTLITLNDRGIPKQASKLKFRHSGDRTRPLYRGFTARVRGTCATKIENVKTTSGEVPQKFTYDIVL